MSLDSHELDGLVATLANAEAQIVAEAKKVMSKGSLNIKTDAARRVTGLAHLPHFPRSITYDIGVQGDTVIAEVGHDKDKLQGVLAAVVELGSVNSAPHPHLYPAADAELPNLERYLGDVAAQLLED